MVVVFYVLINIKAHGTKVGKCRSGRFGMNGRDVSRDLMVCSSFSVFSHQSYTDFAYCRCMVAFSPPLNLPFISCVFVQVSYFNVTFGLNVWKYLDAYSFMGDHVWLIECFAEITKWTGGIV